MNLPDAIIWEIINQAEYDDINTLCKVNKQFERMCAEPRTYQRILFIRDKIREQKVDILLALKWENDVVFKDTFEKLPPAAIEEYNNLVWEEIIKFVEQHPEFINEFEWVFYDVSDLSNPRKALNEWLRVRMGQCPNGVLSAFWADEIYAIMKRTIKRMDLKHDALKQFFLTHPDYTKLMYEYLNES